MRTISNEELEGRGFVVEQGQQDEELARELVEASLDPVIREFTPNDALRRFPNPETAQRWLEDAEAARSVYTLRDEALRKLGGLAWFSQKPISTTDVDLPYDYENTFGIRLYEPARGQDLAPHFAQTVHEDFSAGRPQNGSGIWLETDNNNTRATSLYLELGYRAVDLVGGRLLMVLDPSPEEDEADSN